MLGAARERREANSIRGAITYDKFKELINGAGGFVYAGWCGDAACETAIKEETKATIRLPPRSPSSALPRRRELPQVRQGRRARGAVGESVLTPGFVRTGGALSCEGVPLDADRGRRGHAGVHLQRRRHP